MTAEDWYKQGELLGSMVTFKDWNDEMTQGATSNPGTVQIHIDRALAKAAVEKDWHNDPCHNVDINRKANCKPCNFVAKLTPLMQFTVNGGWSAL